MSADRANSNESATSSQSPSVRICRSVEWYAEGQSRTVEVDGACIVVRFIGRKGRRGRIEIQAPAGAVFRAEQVRRS
jgi:hypothetical protein